MAWTLLLPTARSSSSSARAASSARAGRAATRAQATISDGRSQPQQFALSDAAGALATLAQDLPVSEQKHLCRYAWRRLSRGGSSGEALEPTMTEQCAAARSWDRMQRRCRSAMCCLGAPHGRPSRPGESAWAGRLSARACSGRRHRPAPQNCCTSIYVAFRTTQSMQSRCLTSSKRRSGLG